MSVHGDDSVRGSREEAYAIHFLGKHFIECSYGEQELIDRLLAAERRLARVDEFLEALK